MTDVRKDVEALREALEAGPTRGDWVRTHHRYELGDTGDYDSFEQVTARAGTETTVVLEIYGNDDRDEANGKYVAAAHPDRIERILAALAEAEQQLAKAIADAAEIGCAYLEAEQRAEAAEADARRYRWLRQGGNDEAVMQYSMPGWEDHVWLPSGDELDAAIDAAIAAKEQS